ncbi:SDR family NAD(P)-dependent oxidoreductase [Kitasatospora viridis]|uniref:3-oxoacyl-[acyl-carrier protein] reductase n=1 Tax=Kitasatospora viridis TaxID=281105 RepID=A0A561SF70_9ACTN|nr:SDR family NAD(P)-dependent oxidoreductase [Kitasatospora viridis]TWF73523.1 3-oxoacyl-[acyl-carrier protein] reductase [Kitasatospora viridis]
MSVTTAHPSLQGRTVVITGGSRGIGARTARAFADQGAQVCVVGRDATALAAVADGITDAGGTALPATADVTDSAALAALHRTVADRFGPVDVLAAFAGGVGFPVKSTELTEQLWRESLDANLTSAFLTIQAFLPDMVERGAGSIITMSSSAGRQPSLANLAYGAANAGLVMLTRHLATELGPQGIRVNCIAPSSILTEKARASMPPAVQEQVAAAHPLRRLGTMEDVAETALFLASDAAAYLTGLTIDVAGGRITN